MRTLFLHAGAHKTGSSSIQKNLEKHAPTLEAAGLTYPLGWNPAFHYPHDVFRSTGNANPLAYAMRWKEGEPTYEAFRPERVLEDLFARLTGSEAAVVSHEDLIDAPQHFLATLRDAATAAGWRVKPVILVRDQISWHVSSFNQHIRQNGYTGEFEELVARHMAGPDWWRHVQRFEAVFGRQDVTVRLYHRDLVGESITRYFTGVLGVEVPALEGAQEARFNVSLTNADALVLAHFNRIGGDRAKAGELTRQLRQIPGDGDADLVTDAVARFIRAYYASGNAALAEAYLTAEEADTLEREMSRPRGSEASAIRSAALARAVAVIKALMDTAT